VFPSNTMSLGPSPTSVPSGTLIYLAIWPQQIWAAKLGDVPLLGERELGPHVTRFGQGRRLAAYQVSS